MNKYQKKIAKAYKKLSNFCGFISYREFKKRYKDVLKEEEETKESE